MAKSYGDYGTDDVQQWVQSTLDYENSTAGVLSRNIHNVVGFAREYHSDPETRNLFSQKGWTLDSLKTEFIKALDTSLDQRALESHGVTYGNFRELLSLADGDWNDPEIIEHLYRGGIRILPSD